MRVILSANFDRNEGYCRENRANDGLGFQPHNQGWVSGPSPAQSGPATWLGFPAVWA